ncbi:hypothetical protein GCM10023340_29010 [Nocardioides marinquilinus]|uniref:Cell envelope-related transcriptional attenuator domain-containing protein n=1 Tax=Nocardioides marinquilinus TaxID=1210400 RepID=A0ABP9PTW6_9ACTN
MTDRPGSGRPDDPANGGQGGSDRPDFGWLYGNRPPDDGRGGAEARPEPRPDSGDPDHQATVAMPVQPRDDRAAPEPTRPTQQAPRPEPTRVQPQPPRPAPTPQPVQHQPPPPPAPTPAARPPRRGGGGFWARRVRNPFFWVRMVVLVLVLWLVYTIAVPFIVWRSADQVAYEPTDGDRPGDQDGTTYLLVGSDSRKDLTEEERKELSTGNPSSELTDTILLLHTGSGPSVLLSIPRDTIIDRPFFSGKINGAYARGGAPLLTRVVETETGIRVDEYVEIGLGGVADVVDAVGGIEVCPRERLKDKQAGLDITKGCQEVDGTTALAYSRSRKESTFGDLERVRRQREVIGAIGDKVLSPWSVINPVRWYRLNSAVPDFFRFGEGMSAIGASKWAYAMTKTGSGDNRTCTVPVTDLSANSWNRELADPLFQAIADDDTEAITDEQCTPNGIPVNLQGRRGNG